MPPDVRPKYRGIDGNFLPFTELQFNGRKHTKNPKKKETIAFIATKFLYFIFFKPISKLRHERQTSMFQVTKMMTCQENVGTKA